MYSKYGPLGGFVVSKNILKGHAIKRIFREKLSDPELNGWILYSADENEAYESDSDNFVIIDSNAIETVFSLMFDLYAAPYGTHWRLTYGKEIAEYQVSTTIEFWDIDTKCVVDTYDDIPELDYDEYLEAYEADEELEEEIEEEMEKLLDGAEFYLDIMDELGKDNNLPIVRIVKNDIRKLLARHKKKRKI